MGMEVDGTHEGKDATKGAGQSGGAEKQGDAILSLPSLVPHGEVVDNTGKQAGLSNAEEETSDEEACQVADDT